MNRGILKAYLGRKTVLVSIAADGSDPFNTEIKGLNREASFLEEGHDETA